MTDPRGFLQLQRRVAPYRPVDERRGDWRDVNGRRRRGPRARAGAPVHGLRRAVLPHRLPAREPDPRLERPRRARPLARGARAARRHEQLPRVHRQALPGAVRGGVRADAERRRRSRSSRSRWRSSTASFDEGWVVPRPPAAESGRSVAVVGSGPAGLAAAQQLRRAGHARDGVRARRPPGRPAALRHPRLQAREGDGRPPRRAAARRRASCSAATRRSPTWPTLRGASRRGRAGHRRAAAPRARAARPRAGRHRARDALPDRVATGACAGLDAGPIVATGLRVAILGGGDTSADCLGSAHREGCASVVEIAHGVEPPTERSPLQTWPRWPRLRRSYAAHLEGGDRRYAFETVEFLGRDGRVTGLRDAAGDEIEVDLVLIAVGFAGVEDDLGVALTPRSTMAVDATFATSVAGRVRGRRLRARRRPDRDRDRRRPRVRPRGRPLPDGLDDTALPRSPDPRTLHGWLNSSPLQTPSGRAASPTAPAPSRSRAARPARCPSPGPAAPRRPTARPAPRS